MILYTSDSHGGSIKNSVRRERWKMKYKGQVIDRLNGRYRNTQRKDTYEEAHHAAERLARRRSEYTENYYIKVVKVEEENLR